MKCSRVILDPNPPTSTPTKTSTSTHTKINTQKIELTKNNWEKV